MILVTGATGFVGRRLIKLLIKNNDPKSIVCLVPSFDNDLEISGRNILTKLKVKLVYCDLVTKEGLENLPRSFSVIFNLAANTEVLDKDHRVNDQGMINLINHLKFSKSTHVIHISTMVIYSGRINTRNEIDENTQPKPTNEYSRSKLKGEICWINSAKQKGYRLTVFRPNTIYGKGGRNNGLIDTVDKLTNGNSLLSRINWPGKSSLIYVDDIANIISKTPRILGSKKTKINIYNIDPERLSLSEIIKLFYQYKGINIQNINLPNFFWKYVSSTRKYIYKCEYFLPNKIYNWLWRLSLLSENVIVSNNLNFVRDFKKTIVFSKLKNKIPELAYSRHNHLSS